MNPCGLLRRYLPKGSSTPSEVGKAETQLLPTCLEEINLVSVRRNRIKKTVFETERNPLILAMKKPSR
jgi:hypothetical protein